jgi:Gram-negative bacterial TonB protein C-terminal
LPQFGIYITLRLPAWKALMWGNGVRQPVMRLLPAALLLVLMASPVASQTPQSVALGQRIAAFQAASALERPNIARQVVRDLRSVPKTDETRLIRSQALLVISQQAAIDGRKDLALSAAQQSVDLTVSIAGAEGNVARARAAIAKTQALLLKEEYLLAMTTIIAARRAYGPIQTDSDDVWDSLLLWDAIATASAPSRLEAQIKALDITEQENASLAGARSSLCTASNDLMYKRIPGIGREIVYPVLSAFSGLQGGVAVRSQIDADGRVVKARVTAFAPNDGFAAATENAAPTWRYIIPADASLECRDNVSTIVVFKFR